jgi:hypothetical protein
VDAHEPLLWGVDEEKAAEGPERLTAKRLLGFLVHEDDGAAGIGQLGGRHQAG